MADSGRQAGPRCIALVGPFASGKTSLLEALLARTGAVTRQGRVKDGNTVGDASAEAVCAASCVVGVNCKVSPATSLTKVVARGRYVRWSTL